MQMINNVFIMNIEVHGIRLSIKTIHRASPVAYGCAKFPRQLALTGKPRNTNHYSLSTNLYVFLPSMFYFLYIFVSWISVWRTISISTLNF